MSYDDWKLQNPPHYDLPPKKCECGVEIEDDETFCGECWAKRDALGLTLAEINELEKRR